MIFTSKEINDLTEEKKYLILDTENQSWYIRKINIRIDFESWQKINLQSI